MFPNIWPVLCVCMYTYIFLQTFKLINCNKFCSYIGIPISHWLKVSLGSLLWPGVWKSRWHSGNKERWAVSHTWGFEPKPPLIMSITQVTGPCSHNATQPNYSLFSVLIPPAFLASGSQPELWCLVTENKYLLSTEGRSWFLHLRRFTQPSPLQPDIKYTRAEGKRCWSDLKLRPPEAWVTNWDKPQ